MLKTVAPRTVDDVMSRRYETEKGKKALRKFALTTAATLAATVAVIKIVNRMENEKPEN
jgi:hypothetical protein